jgi:hypothetical protein
MVYPVFRDFRLHILGMAAVLFPLLSSGAAEKYFEIEIQDAGTGRGVPLVELVTVNKMRYVTDSAGRVAFFEPGLMGQTIFFDIHAQGYEVPKDGFGIAGARLKIEEGGSATVKLKRRNIAERLYRLHRLWRLSRHLSCWERRRPSLNRSGQAWWRGRTPSSQHRIAGSFTGSGVIPAGCRIRWDYSGWREQRRAPWQRRTRSFGWC